MKPIRTAIVGVGNCAKSLIEGVTLYSNTKDTSGLMFPNIGGYLPKDIQFVLAYDVDRRKILRPLREAMLNGNNCAMPLANSSDPYECCGDTQVKMGRIMDGVAPHMEDVFQPSKDCPELSASSLVRQLVDNKIDVLLNYLPVGSEEATRFYLGACIDARVPFVNCIPVFIVSDPAWQRKLDWAGIPAIGDDMRSQVGASVLSQVLQEMFLDRGAKVKFHCQTNQGGNTDFQNMLDSRRLINKKRSKEAVITSQNEIRNVVDECYVHAGPSDYIPYLGDNKVAHIRIEAEGFGGAPITLDCRLSVQDSPNSAGVVIDAIRYLATARKANMTGPLYGASAATQKSPPRQLTYAEAFAACKALAGYRWDPV